MKLEYQVVNLELAKKLKELDVKQESLFYWAESIDGYYTHKGYCLYYSRFHDGKRDTSISAFTVAELGQMLPTTIDNLYNDYTLWLNNRKTRTCGGNDGFQYHVWYTNAREEEQIIWSDTTEANARARMLIHLLEKEVIQVLSIKEPKPRGGSLEPPKGTLKKAE